MKRLCVKDEEILWKDEDEMHTSLGDVLTTSVNLYKDLQLTYYNNNIIK